jgi:hypothetical protein
LGLLFGFQRPNDFAYCHFDFPARLRGPKLLFELQLPVKRLLDYSSRVPPAARDIASRPTSWRGGAAFTRTPSRSQPLCFRPLFPPGFRFRGGRLLAQPTLLSQPPRFGPPFLPGFHFRGGRLLLQATYSRQGPARLPKRTSSAWMPERPPDEPARRLALLFNCPGFRLRPRPRTALDPGCPLHPQNRPPTPRPPAEGRAVWGVSTAAPVG